ncbi:hypothetical protein AJ79_00581 [Helicocarpus griseus UAMH5409]|uniref:Aminoglycoside phosphotransferase domain-containing protein n=1 Tax=Helicocarpus griseus UAMH5409 TaxID=1447875 RepID=A0A2B7YBJ4_9EURO|nr:hypothetical protein AJ79_00581 [Helicocarpus griseus UAMH5409]
MFAVGPIALREFWDKERAQMSIDRGPWETARGYVEAVAHREISWISKYASSSARNPSYLKLPEAQLSPQEHIGLLNKYLGSISTLLPDSPDLVRPTLWHHDIQDGNLFIHDGRISSVIDWQSIWAAPLILQAQAPRLIDYNGEILLTLPENFNKLNQDEKAEVRDQVSRSIQMFLYEDKTAKENPLLSDAFTQPFGKSLSQLVSFAGNSWDDDIIPLRECLIELERHWHKIGTAKQCPYHFTDDDIRRHREDAEGFNETQDFWDSLEGKVDRSGWAANEDFDDAVDSFLRLRKVGLDKLNGEERKDFESQTLITWFHRRREFSRARYI